MVAPSIGSSGGVGGGGKTHAIYVAAFGGHLFYDLFVQGLGEGAWPPRHPPGSATGAFPIAYVEVYEIAIGFTIFNSQPACRNLVNDAII